MYAFSLANNSEFEYNYKCSQLVTESLEGNGDFMIKSNKNEH